jgi:hypothetical protein
MCSSRASAQCRPPQTRQTRRTLRTLRAGGVAARATSRTRDHLRIHRVDELDGSSVHRSDLGSFTVNVDLGNGAGGRDLQPDGTPVARDGFVRKNLSATAATLCYTASPSAKVTEVFVYRSRYANSGVGSAVSRSGRSDRPDSCCLQDVHVHLTQTRRRSTTSICCRSPTAARPHSSIGQSGITSGHERNGDRSTTRLERPICLLQRRHRHS